MIFYEFNKPNNKIIQENKTITVFDSLSFFEVENIININDTYVSFNKEITVRDFDCARYLRKGNFSYYEEGEKVKKKMTKKEKEKGLEVRKEMKILKLKKHYEIILSNAFDVLSVEKSSWERQKTEADAYTLDNTADIPFIAALAEARGIDLETLVSKILEKAEQYALFVAGTIGTQHKQEADILAASTLEELDALELPDFCTFYFDR
jgi:hypothetical protein